MLRRIRWRPLSLAEKCRLMFGGAVFLSLSLVLVFPYLWMQKLTTKGLIDVSQERANLFYRSHFRLDKLAPGRVAGPGSERRCGGRQRRPYAVDSVWPGPHGEPKSLDEPHQGVIRSLLLGPSEDDFQIDSRGTRPGKPLLQALPGQRILHRLPQSTGVGEGLLHQ